MAEESTANGTAVSNVDDADARGTLQGAMAGLSLGTSSKVQTTHSPQLVATAPAQSVASASSQQQAFLSRLAERKQSEKYRRFATEVQRIDLVKPYETSRFGYCVLINEKEFDERATGQRRRDGTDVDADYAEAVFGALGFQVVRFNDLNVTSFRRVISRFASQTNHSSFDMFVMIVLSHGVEGRVFASDGDLSVDADLVDPFRGANCASLIGKPKMFFIQACRGSKFDRGVDVKDGGRTRIPNEADLLIFSSTTPGYFSWRNNQDGKSACLRAILFISACLRSRSIGTNLSLQHRVFALRFLDT